MKGFGTTLTAPPTVVALAVVALSVVTVTRASLASGPMAEGEESAFPHVLHVEEEGLECLDCHGQAMESDAASDYLLDTQVCLDCHDEGDVPMEWPSVAGDILFGHRHHAEGLEMDCLACHAGALQEGAGALPSMDGCMTCHTGLQAPRECGACHLAGLVDLIPPSHDAGWADSHGSLARIDDTGCVPCHAVSDCQECHEGALLSELASLGGARQSPFGPELAGSQGLILQRAHGLNYRFLHALEARGKTSDCITCHELDTGDFCGECHNPAGDAGLRPMWHGGADWGALAGAVGSGGGRHADLARRDMENCAACHETQVDDPTCLLCHMDRTPGRGNDPRTHGRDFADDVGQGDFHDDPDALCFACHRQTAVGTGFCGYCHGIE